MRKKDFLPGLLFFSFLFSAAITWAQPIPVTGKTINGIFSADFNTPDGKITLLLPADIRPGESVSGSIHLDPAGINEKEKGKNREKLSKYYFSTGGRQIPVSGLHQSFEWLPQQDPGIPAHIELWNDAAVKMADLSLTMPASVLLTGPFVNDFYLSKHIFFKDERVVLISPYGNIRNNSSFTWQEPGGRTQDLSPLIRSPRQAVFDIPMNAETGKTFLTVQTPAMNASLPVQENVTLAFSLVDFEFNAQKTNLGKGEQTIIWWQLKGLDTTRPELPAVVIRNLSSAQISIPEGNFQVTRITPANAQTRNEQPVQALRSGSFNIHATVSLAAADHADIFSLQLEAIRSKNDYDNWAVALKKDLSAFSLQQPANKTGQAAKSNLQWVTENLPLCPDDDHLNECLDATRLLLRNLTIPRYAADEWLTGYETYRIIMHNIAGSEDGFEMLLNKDLIMNGLRFLATRGKELGDQELQLRTGQAMDAFNHAIRVSADNAHWQEPERALKVLNTYAEKQIAGIEAIPVAHYHIAWNGSKTWQEAFEEPGYHYDVPVTHNEVKTDTIPCRELEETVKQSESALSALTDELAEIGSRIYNLQRALTDCQETKDKELYKAWEAAAADFKKEETRNTQYDANRGKFSDKQNEDQKKDFKDAKDKKDAAAKKWSDQDKQCKLIELKIAQLKARKEKLPGLISAAAEALKKAQEALEKCKTQAAEDKKRKEEEERRNGTGAQPGGESTQPPNTGTAGKPCDPEGAVMFASEKIFLPCEVLETEVTPCNTSNFSNQLLEAIKKILEKIEKFSKPLDIAEKIAQCGSLTKAVCVNVHIIRKWKVIEHKYECVNGKWVETNTRTTSEGQDDYGFFQISDKNVGSCCWIFDGSKAMETELANAIQEKLDQCK